MAVTFGPVIGASGTTFRLWAPSAPAVSLIFPDSPPIDLQKSEHGFWTVTAKDCGPGTRYKFRIGGLNFPDPASRQQVGGTSGWSLVSEPIEPSGRKQPLSPWHEALICEVHVGTVTPEGTFTALADKLEHFRDAGYTTLEIMPINTFPGSRNWGYDGTLIFAPAEAYGTRQELRALVDRAHALGICLVLDVVYNHFGEFDNLIEHYAPEWFDPDINTPWGPGIDFREEAVRQFYYENAMMWLSEFDFDGLRFDSVHEMKTECRDDFLTGLADACRSVKSHAKLIIENMDNSASWLERDADGTPKTYTAQWDDDIHHVLNYLVADDDKGGYDDPSKDPIADLEKGLADGFIHDGEAEGESNGSTRNEPGSDLPPAAFVSYVQNHDQIGNRADSARLPDRIGPEKLDFLHFAVMLAPQVPLFFMGEEADLRTHFPFFLDLPEKAAAIKREDRYKQMREIFNEDVEDGGLPDPNDPATFAMAKIDWSDFDQPQSQASLARFRELAQWRKDHVWPLTGSKCLDARSGRQGNAVVVNWIFESGTLSMALNPTNTPTDLACTITAPPLSTGDYSQEGEVLRLGAWSAVAWVWRNG
ncbi:alpha-amylase family glycosyl hydrolase [Devosia rhizoryzae]|uniref:Malto-oligosyltrehalose trehalohydrolase n=1 Tax=Devosia rhizoryzae TaxID=2774137 RepID=A0ABX7C366_9HYPH|nr:alpha-amylase family glycosyl hydrolase [Devosia rhizoryzae]QQR38673.1 malto-oligosyltrehalose trehalohydrolase [Devosia rhizoryzae]